MEDKKSDALNDVRNYRKMVLIYEALDEQIDKLIMETAAGAKTCRRKLSNATVIWHANAMTY